MSRNIAHPIHLIGQVLFVRSVVVAIPGYDPSGGEPNVAPQNNLDVKPSGATEGLFDAGMRTVINPSSDNSGPYHIDIECVAQLGADPSLSAEEALRGVTITAHSVLYGAIRETVSWLTSRQPYGALGLGLSVLRPPPPVDAASEQNAPESSPAKS